MVPFQVMLPVSEDRDKQPIWLLLVGELVAKVTVMTLKNYDDVQNGTNFSLPALTKG